jgi:hypothetical protein
MFYVLFCRMSDAWRGFGGWLRVCSVSATLCGWFCFVFEILFLAIGCMIVYGLWIVLWRNVYEFAC